MNVILRRHLLVVFTPIAAILLLVGLLLELQFDVLRAYFGEERNSASSTIIIESSGPFLEEEEVVIIESTSTHDTVFLPVEKVFFEYVEVNESCGIHYGDDCVLVRSGPGTEFPIVTRLRNHTVLKIDGKVVHEDHTWYKIVFDETLRFPERVQGDWYIVADYVDILLDEGEKTVWENESATTTKRIVVDISEQKLYAYDGDIPFMEISISTGLELSPTPRGTFTIFKKTPSRYMQGPLPGHSDVYDLPGVPWNLYFTHEGAVIHGTYWHDSFGSRYSHGCVNVSPNNARRLYNWAVLGTKVIVQQ